MSEFEASQIESLGYTSSDQGRFTVFRRTDEAQPQPVLLAESAHIQLNVTMMGLMAMINEAILHPVVGDKMRIVKMGLDLWRTGGFLTGTQVDSLRRELA